MSESRIVPAEPINYEVMLQNETRAITDRLASPSSTRVRLRGNYSIVLPDGSEGEEIEVVIVDFCSNYAYFDQPYDPDTPMPPACFAISFDQKTLSPSPNSPDPQADSCATCPMNQFGSSLVGKGKACKNTLQLAIMPVAYDDTDPPLWTVSIPPTGIKHFNAYAVRLASRYRTVPIGVVTKISLKREVSWSEPLYEVVRPLRTEEFETYLSRREQAKEMLLTEPDVSSYVPPRRPRGRR